MFILLARKFVITCTKILSYVFMSSTVLRLKVDRKVAADRPANVQFCTGQMMRGILV